MDYNVSNDIVESLDRYVDHRIETGSFLRACLENNLMEAFGRADAFNSINLKNICMYIYNEIPSSCHGSREVVAAWLCQKDA